MEKTLNNLEFDLSDEIKELKKHILRIFKEYDIPIFQNFDDQHVTITKEIKNDELDILNENIALLHQYVKNSLFGINKYLKEIASIDYNDYFRLKELHSSLKTLEFEVNSHISKEERFIHVVKYLHDCERFKERPKMRGFKSVQFHVRNLEAEHTKLILLVKSIKKSLDSLFSENRTFKSLISEIHDLSNALYNCILIEKHFLFPQTISLENNLLKIY